MLLIYKIETDCSVESIVMKCKFAIINIKISIPNLRFSILIGVLLKEEVWGASEKVTAETQNVVGIFH